MDTAMSLLSVASFVDIRLEEEDWRSFVLATQIVEILVALLPIEIIAVAVLSLLPIFSYYLPMAIICFVFNIVTILFLWWSRYFQIDSKVQIISLRIRVKLAGNAIVTVFFALGGYELMHCGIFSAGFCFLFALPLVTIVVTGSKISCLFFGIASIIAQQTAIVLQGLGHTWPRPLIRGTIAMDLLLFNAFLCFILNVFIIGISVRFCLSHKKINDAMQSATNQVKQLLEEKVNFIANATHELRTPVMQILALVELLSSVNKEAESKSLIETLRSATMGVIELVNDVLDYEKIGKGMVKLEHTPFDIRELIKRLVSMSALQAHSKQIELMAITYERVPDIIVGDQMRLYQILQNVMSNAIKFTVPRERTNEIFVKVDCHLVASDPSKLQLEISVKDSGIGLARDSIPYLFQAFHQASSSTSRMFGGTGLGLAISRNLARAMNGDISVESDGPGKGTVFNVTVHVGKQAGTFGLTRSRIHGNQLPQTGSDTVVIFDDVQTALSLLEDSARRLGYNDVRSFSGFSELMRFLSLKNPIPSLIVVDVGATGSDPESAFGIARLQLIRNLDAAFQNIPVVALKDQDDVFMGPTPFTTYYSKPIIAEQVQSAMLSALLGTDVQLESTTKATSLGNVWHKPRCLHVLLVDDNSVSLKVIGRMMEHLGHEVTMCSSGSSALQILYRSQSEQTIAGQSLSSSNNIPICAVITDFQMPEMSGLQLVKEIRRREQDRPGFQAIPVILTSGDSRSAIQKEMELYEKTYFLMKPFTVRDLQSLLDKCCHDNSNSTKAPSLNSVDDNI